MKAKHFRRLRKECNYYDVDESISLFGRFNWDWKHSIKILARNPFEAIERARRKGYAKRKEQPSSIYCDSEQWATFRVKKHSTMNKHKNIIYFQ